MRTESPSRSTSRQASDSFGRTADELIVYDNTVHRRGFRVVAQFTGGNLRKIAQTIPDWAAKVFGKTLQVGKQLEKSEHAR
jgi:hypothetical protein